jgi:hypothetical protein
MRDRTTFAAKKTLKLLVPESHILVGRAHVYMPDPFIPAQPQ